MKGSLYHPIHHFILNPFPSSANSQQMEYTDITELLLRKAQVLQTGVVVKSPSFSLFEGTHALEIDNEQLDTGLIVLSDEEINFDCTAPRSLAEVLWASDSLLRSIFTWLNNSSLSVTVFSCRYAEELLINYNNAPQLGLNSCTFGSTTINSDLNYLLVHKVLRSVVLGVLNFARLCTTLGQAGVIIEEEDINTSNLNFDLISLISTDDLLKELQGSLTFIQKHYPDERDSMLLQSLLQILCKLIEVPYYLSTKVSKAGTFLNTSTVESLKTYTDVLHENVAYLNSLPHIPGCFSMGIQKRRDNRSPTRQLISPSTEDYSSLKHFLNDLMQILSISQRKYPHDIVNHALIFANTNHHVLARAIYPLFLIRDDRTILGEEPFHELLIEELLHFSCCDTETFTTDNEIVKVKLTEMLDQISIGYYEWFNALNQNPCRQRQNFSHAILTFDTLQATCENFEIELNTIFQIQDEFEYNGELAPALPITSWLFYKKIDIMLQVVFRGFELELYNSWEFHPMYWYAVHLHDHIIMLLDRVIKFNEHKIDKIKNMSKQLKKKKGDQKLRYKEKMVQKQLHEMVMLEKSVEMLHKLVTKYEVTRGVCHLQMIHLDNYLKQGLKVPDFPFLRDEETLYKFRLKPFSTVGVPNCPDYSQYQRDFKHFTSDSFQHSQQEINSVKTKLMFNLKLMTDGIQAGEESIGFKICKEDWLQWYKDMQRSSIAIMLSIGKESEGGRFVVERQGLHRYFPLVKRV